MSLLLQKEEINRSLVFKLAPSKIKVHHDQQGSNDKHGSNAMRRWEHHQVDGGINEAIDRISHKKRIGPFSTINGAITRCKMNQGMDTFNKHAWQPRRFGSKKRKAILGIGNNNEEVSHSGENHENAKKNNIPWNRGPASFHFGQSGLRKIKRCYD